MTVMIRPAEPADLPALLALFAELHPGDAPLPLADAAQIWPTISAQAGRAVMVADVEGSVAGTLDYTILPNLTRGGRPFMLVENVVVGSTARRRGVGRRLLDAALAAARSSNCYKVQLLSRADRGDAHAFYESYGFRALAAGYRVYLD